MEEQNLPGEVSRSVDGPDELSLSLDVIQSDPPVSVAVHLILILDPTEEILQEVELFHAKMIVISRYQVGTQQGTLLQYFHQAASLSKVATDSLGRGFINGLVIEVREDTAQTNRSPVSPALWTVALAGLVKPMVPGPQGNVHPPIAQDLLLLGPLLRLLGSPGDEDQAEEEESQGGPQ